MKILFPAFLLLVCIAVRAQNPRPVKFESLSPSETGVDFANNLTESPQLNIITYEYFYNGGGVGLADFNNDGLIDMYLSGNMVPGKLYINKGNWHFEDITPKSGIKTKKGWKTGVSIADVNGDGYQDIYISYSGPVDRKERTNQLYINNGDLTFTEKAGEMGIADSGYSTQAVFFDYDRDNDLDLFVINHNNKNFRNFDAAFVKKMVDPDAGDRLYRNDNGKFTDVTLDAGIISNPLGYGLGLVVSDLNNDGWPDMYITNDYVEEDYMYINNGDGTFTDKLKDEVGHLSNFSMGCDVADINNDGWSDVFTLDMLPEDNRRQKLLYMPDNYELYNNQVGNGFYHQLMRNMLQVNNGNATFSEIGQVSGVFCTDWSWGALLTDFNNDGNKDLFITNGYGRDMTNRDFVKFYANERLKYLRGQPSENMFRILQGIPVTPVHDYLYLNNGDMVFTDASAASGFTEKTLSNGAAYADLDNDGDLDLVINHLNAPVEIRRNMLVENGHANNWVNLTLKGTGKNVSALGAVADIYSGGEVIRLENTPVHGYQSAMQIPLHTGLPSPNIDSIVVIWPDGTMQSTAGAKTNSTVPINYKPDRQYVPQPASKRTVFKESTVPFPYTNVSQETNDYKDQPLMPSMISHNGPHTAKADINNDGLDDIFICGSSGQAGELYVQLKNGNFIKVSQPALDADAGFEDTDAAFFDADSDGDLDLYVVSGGYIYNEGDAELQDRLYLNNNGVFTKSVDALPKEGLSGSCVRVADVDKDGDSDLFVGSRITPARFPESPRSLLLLNDGHGKFSNPSVEMQSAFDSLGMVTDALWFDADKDGDMDLLVCGEWMLIHLFINDGGHFTDQSAKYLPEGFKGWWNRLHLADMDGDGDLDLIAGNWGLNSSMKVSKQEPAVMYYNDFDQNGSIDPLICYYIQGKSYPMASRDEMTDQMVSLRQRFPTYDSYANTTIEDILTPEQLGSARELTTDHFETTYFENDNGIFRSRPLPVQANFFPVYAIATGDFDQDGNQDMLLGGNVDHARIKIGKIDAGYGVLLKGDGKGNFSYSTQLSSGLSVKGCTRDIVDLKTPSGHKVLFAINNQSPLIYSY